MWLLECAKLSFNLCDLELQSRDHLPDQIAAGSACDGGFQLQLDQLRAKQLVQLSLQAGDDAIQPSGLCR